MIFQPNVVTGQTNDETVTELDTSSTPKNPLPNQKMPWNAIKHYRADISDSGIADTLREIRDLIQQSRQVDVPADFTHPRAYTLGLLATTISLEGLTQYGYLYVAPVNRDYTVYLGYGIQQRIINVSAGVPLSLRIPHIDVLTLDFSTASEYDTLYAYLSTRPMEAASGNTRLNRGGDVQLLTITAGATTSSVLDVQEAIIAGAAFPATMTGASFTVEVSAFSSGPFAPLLDDTGAAYTRPLAGNDRYTLPGDLAAWNYARIVSASAEAATRTITVNTKR